MAEHVDGGVARHVVAADEISGAVRAARLFVVEIVDIAEAQIGLETVPLPVGAKLESGVGAKQLRTGWSGDAA